MQYNLSKFALKAVAIAAALTVSSAFADSANIASGKDIFNNGKGSVPACISCHGTDGMGNDGMGTPRLAGQVYQFLVKQLQDFADNKRMDTTMFIMNDNARGLSEQDRKDVSAFLSTLDDEGGASDMDQLRSMGTTVGTRYLGKAIVNYGIPEKGISSCKACHGYNGRGVDPIYPQIGGQKYVYLVNQLKKWRDGSRANDPMGQMRAIARKLSDTDINNAAAYLTSASAYSMGNTRLPERHVPFDH